MNIYIDYDELLVHCDIHRGGSACKDAVLVKIDKTYHCQKRPSAEGIIDTFKVWAKYGGGELILLTSGDRDYVKASSEGLGLVLPSKWICSEDWLMKVSTWGSTERAPKELNLEPDALLIEHTDICGDPNTWGVKTKVKYLGLTKPEQLLIFPPYTGYPKEGKKFDEAFKDAIVMAVKWIHKDRPPISPNID